MAVWYFNLVISKLAYFGIEEKQMDLNPGSVTYCII